MWRDQDKLGSDPLADRDRGVATGLDDARQQAIGRRLFGLMFQPDGAVVQFLGAEFRNRLGKTGSASSMLSS